MNFQEIAEKAFKNENTEKLWDLPERQAYLELEQLYYNYKLGNISKENSITKKKQIEKNYYWDKEKYENALSVYKKYNENRLNNSILLAELEKSIDKRTMIEKALQIIANEISDNSFVERNLQKFDKFDF